MTLRVLPETDLFNPNSAAYLSVSKDQEGAYLPPPFIFWVGFWLGFQFFLEMTCLVVIYHIQKDSFSLDDQAPPPIMIFLVFHWSERPPTQFARVPPYEILVFLTNFIFYSKMR